MLETLQDKVARGNKRFGKRENSEFGVGDKVLLRSIGEIVTIKSIYFSEAPTTARVVIKTKDGSELAVSDGSLERVSDSKNNSSLAEEIVDNIQSSFLDEKACIAYAVDHGYTKAEGQKAWQVIFKEMKDFNSKKNESSQLHLMSPMALDKYMSAMSDVGLQTIIDGEHEEAVKKVATAHLGDRVKKKEEEMTASAPKKENTADILSTRLARGKKRYSNSSSACKFYRSDIGTCKIGCPSVTPKGGNCPYADDDTQESCPCFQYR